MPENLKNRVFGWISRSHTTEVGWWGPAVTVAKHWMVRFALTPLPGASFPAAGAPTHTVAADQNPPLQRGHCCGAPRIPAPPAHAVCSGTKLNYSWVMAPKVDAYALAAKKPRVPSSQALPSLIGHIFVLLQTHKQERLWQKSLDEKTQERQNFIQSSQQLQTWVLFSKNQNWRNTSPKKAQLTREQCWGKKSGVFWLQGHVLNQNSMLTHFPGGVVNSWKCSFQKKKKKPDWFVLYKQNIPLIVLNIIIFKLHTY